MSMRLPAQAPATPVRMRKRRSAACWTARASLGGEGRSETLRTRAPEDSAELPLSGPGEAIGASGVEATSSGDSAPPPKKTHQTATFADEPDRSNSGRMFRVSFRMRRGNPRVPTPAHRVLATAGHPLSSTRSQRRHVSRSDSVKCRLTAIDDVINVASRTKRFRRFSN